MLFEAVLDIRDMSLNIQHINIFTTLTINLQEDLELAFKSYLQKINDKLINHD